MTHLKIYEHVDTYKDEEGGRETLLINLKSIADAIEDQVQKDNPNCDVEICGVERWEY